MAPLIRLVEMKAGKAWRSDHGGLDRAQIHPRAALAPARPGHAHDLKPRGRSTRFDRDRSHKMKCTATHLQAITAGTSALAQVLGYRESCRVARIPSPAAALVGDRIRSRRLELEMTQDQLAHACDIDPSNLRAYENGRGLPNVYTVVRISAALMLERPGDLLDGLTTELFTPRNQ